MKILTLGMVILLGAGSAASAAVKSQVIEYKQGDANLEGYLAWDDASQSKRPGILVVHEWTGLGEYAKSRARKLAELGYVAFENEMRSGGVDWQLVVYGGAVHSFTNPDSGNDKTRGAAYDEKADRRSWDAMKTFFAEIFK